MIQKKPKRWEMSRFISYRYGSYLMHMQYHNLFGDANKNVCQETENGHLLM